MGEADIVIAIFANFILIKLLYSSCYLWYLIVYQNVIN